MPLRHEYQGHFERHETTGDWRWVDPAWSSEWQPAPVEAHDAAGLGRGKGKGAKAAGQGPVEASVAAARAEMTLEEASQWAAELTATNSQTPKAPSPLVAHDGMPKFVELPHPDQTFGNASSAAKAVPCKDVGIPPPATAPSEWQGPISPFSPKKRESEKSSSGCDKNKKEKLKD